MIKIVPDKEGRLTQWDLNRKVIVTGYEGVAEVHFASPGDDHGAYVVKLIDGEAGIPNILLTMAGTINVYVYPADRTVFATTLWVMAREKPDDYVYTETEVLSYKTLDEKIGDVDERLSNLSEEIADLPQPDWNQNDDTQPDYVKNRPFWRKIDYNTYDLSVYTEPTYIDIPLIPDLPGVSGTVTINVNGVDTEYTVLWSSEYEVYYIGVDPADIDYNAANGWAVAWWQRDLPWIYTNNSSDTLIIPAATVKKISNDYLPIIQRVAFTKSFYNDGALSDTMSDGEVLDSMVLNIPVLKATRYTVDQICCSPDGKLYLPNEYVTFGSFVPGVIEINSDTLISETFELTIPYGDIYMLQVRDIYTKTKCEVYFPRVDQSETQSSVGIISNTFTQSVAYINGHLFVFCTSSLPSTETDRTITLTVKKIL